MIPYIDIHTHQPSSSQAVFEVANIIPFEVPVGGTGHFSAGVHPWYIVKDQLEAYRDWLGQLSAEKHCLMIGEAGLDGFCQTDALFQDQVFRWQIELSASLNKPLMVHCVKRYNEMIVLSDQYNGHSPWILHGFQSSVEMVHHLLDRNFLFSFGAALLRPNPKLVAALRDIPIDRLFLETDDAGVPIERIYEAAAAFLEMDMARLKVRMYNNFKRLFNVDELA